MAFSRVRTIRRSRFALAISSGLFALGVSACEHTPLTAPSGSAITFNAPATASTADAVTIDVVVLESKSAPTTTTNQGGGNQGLTNGGNNNNNATSTAGGGTYVHDGTVVTFTTTVGELSATEAKTRLGHATVTLFGTQAGRGQITAISGNVTATHPFEFKDPPSGGGGRP